jgi:hypothetical protein
MSATRKLFAYIDETGDRGAGPNSSPIFGMACVLIEDKDAPGLTAAVDDIRATFGVPATAVLSWKDYIKTHERRKYVAQKLATVPGLEVIYVYSQKSELQPGSYANNRERFYNYVAYKMYKNILWAARNKLGPAGQIWTRFGHVRGHDHHTTADYFNRMKLTDHSVPFHMEQGLKWVSADKYKESQAADAFGGFLKAATWPDQFGNFEGSYLTAVWSLVRNSSNCTNTGNSYCAIPLGFMPMPTYRAANLTGCIPCQGCTQIS